MNDHELVSSVKNEGEIVYSNYTFGIQSLELIYKYKGKYWFDSYCAFRGPYDSFEETFISESQFQLNTVRTIHCDYWSNEKLISKLRISDKVVFPTLFELNDEDYRYTASEGISKFTQY